MGVLCGSPNPPIIHFAPKTAQLPLKNSEKPLDGSSTQTDSLRSLIQSKCPSLFTPFEPAWWLANGHMQTTFSVFADLSEVDSVWYRRQHLSLLDGGTLGLDFAPIDDSKLNEDTPIIVIQHGLSGGSYEPYIKAIVSRATLPVNKGGLGYRSVVVHHRGCGGVPVTSPKLYTAGGTDDIRQALMYISNKYPRAILLGLGFSLGANIMTRYLAQEGENSRLSCACALANPWDLAANSDQLESTYVGKYIYNRALGYNLLSLTKQHYKPLALDQPDLPIAKSLTKLMPVTKMTLTEYDDQFSRHIGGPAPEYPFPNVNAFYNAMSSHKVIGDIRVPFLALNSADDPVVQCVPMDGAGNKFVIMVLTWGGGHLGWFNNGSGDRWTTQPVLEWLRLMGEDVALKSGYERGKRVFVGDTGFLQEDDGRDLGCKETDGGCLINGNAGVDGVFKGL